MVKSKTGKNGELSPALPTPLQNTGNNRILQVDILKGLAIIAVILIHTFPDVLLAFVGAPYYLWQAVPVFLLLAAFTGALSYRRLKKRTLLQSYDLTVFYRRFKRILLPFIVICIIQIAVILWLLPKNMPLYVQYAAQLQSGIFGTLAFLVGGAAGMGNYFVPLILIQILALPFFYWLAIRYSPNAMLAFAFVLDIALQYGLSMAGISSAMSGLNYINYLFLTALGIWFALQVRKQTTAILIAGLLSAAYITAVYYFKFQFWFISPSSGFFTEFSYFWTLVLVMYGIQYLPSSHSSKSFSIIAELGKASWHIFLVQMTFLAIFMEAMVSSISNAIAEPGLFGALIAQAELTLPSLVICSGIGYGFYLAEDALRKKYPRIYS